MTQPTLVTQRLTLRPFTLADAKRVQELAGHPLIAATTAAIPHPYPDGAAESWISNHSTWFSEGLAVTYAITLKSNDELIGCIDFLGISKTHQKAEVGYWIGIDHWGQGYCTEALQELIKYGFESLNLNKITSRHISTNPASGKVMRKAGMKKEGHFRKDMFKNGTFHDMEVYGLLKEDF